MGWGGVRELTSTLGAEVVPRWHVFGAAPIRIAAKAAKNWFPGAHHKLEHCLRVSKYRFGVIVGAGWSSESASDAVAVSVMSSSYSDGAVVDWSDSARGSEPAGYAHATGAVAGSLWTGVRT